ncbi:zf-DHHC-domain-containing protein [Daedalea quercina L-15889]|uniref:Palmitoyltransferase n=1 Tax=Daedalea quercina L-15889 TaxID=1314783 RepID=A0A165P963_9APHY|nr:zf-DHHC-domain-containing protein [Daedalea quercina L-15889]
MICARQVFLCFRAIERVGDKITGAAGPVFVTLGVVLLSIGAACFFEVVRPTLPLPWLMTPICLLITFNLLMHYFWVCIVPPGFVTDPPRERGSGWLWAKPRGRNRPPAGAGVRWSEEVNITTASVTRCKRCKVLRPEERAHHCRICNKCILKYDHHCPVRVNQCVGLYNERHFVLFLIYMCLATFCYAVSGWRGVLAALGLSDDEAWPYYSPPVFFIATYVLSVVLCLAVTIMTSWHLYGISCGETSVESADHEQYRQTAKGRGETFVNSYDLGKRKNLELFFNLGVDGYPSYTLLFPFRIEPYTDGRSWARRPGYEGHLGVREGEELTDPEDDE